jgi:transcriptional regulator with GAF, ATPase, and Fis domain
LKHLPTVSTVFGHALERKATEAARQSELVELQSRGRTTEHEVLYRPEVGVACGSGLMASESPKIREILTQVELVAPTSATVLLLGETGAGKEVFAQAIHDISPRRHRQMIRVSCAAIPSALVESELFGCERGAFTDAVTRRIGRFEAASQSTLFLDEIGNLPANAQVKLLRVLQDHVIERLGSTHPIKIDIRIIVATNRNLDDAVADKSFREDLFYRLNVFPIVVPPLRERPEDIAGLVWQFVDEFGQSFNKPIASISKESMRALRCYSWPGNVRELRNVIERAVIMSSSPRLTPQVPRHPPLEKSRATMTLAQVEAEHIRATLESTNWRIRGQGGAAERLALKPTTLESRLVKLGIERPQPSPYESRRL